MTRKRRKESKAARPHDRASLLGGGKSSPFARGLFWVVATVIVAGAGAVGMSALEGRILTGRTGPVPAQMEVGLASKPDWMPRALANEITRGLLPPGADYYDKDLTGRIRTRALANPWVGRVVRVAKYADWGASHAAVELEAEFRMPVAKVKTEEVYTYLDATGYRLPAAQVPKWAAWDAAAPDNRSYYLERDHVPTGMMMSRIHYMLVEGAEGGPPAVGHKWPGEDMAAGLALVELVAPKPYAYQITEIDVRNFGGRIDPDQPHLRMWAQFGQSNPTDIRFGRFPRPDGDYVVSPERKLSYLDQYAQDHNGALSGASRYIDLRYDELHVSLN